MAIILDASLLYALFNMRDAHHQTARAIIHKLNAGAYGAVIITDHVFDEVLSVMARKMGRAEAVQTGQFLLESDLTIICTPVDVFQSAWNIFRQDQLLSFTDCTLVAVSDYFRINNIATFDKKFKKIKGLHVVGC